MGLILFLILSAIWVFGGAWWSWRHHKDEDFADIAMLFYSLYLVIGFQCREIDGMLVVHKPGDGAGRISSGIVFTHGDN